MNLKCLWEFPQLLDPQLWCTPEVQTLILLPPIPPSHQHTLPPGPPVAAGNPYDSGRYQEIGSGYPMGPAHVTGKQLPAPIGQPSPPMAYDAQTSIEASGYEPSRVHVKNTFIEVTGPSA